MIATGQVISIQDDNDGERIKVRIRPADNHLSDDKLPYAYPLLPKIIHIKPKVGEAVLIMTDDDRVESQRYYLGPLISQPQFFERQLYLGGATNLMKGGSATTSEPIKNLKRGAFPNDNDVAICGRKNCDIILSDNDIRIRCGVHKLREQMVDFNTQNPAFIKLKFYPDKLTHKTIEVSSEGGVNNLKLIEKTEEIGSVTNIVADKINLIGNTGSPKIKIDDTNESLSDEQMIYFLDKAHQLPYGDKLCEFLSEFLNMFKNHTHNYTNLPIVRDSTVQAFDRKYGTTSKQIGKLLLSDSVRIN